MTTTELKTARARLGLSQAGLAAALRLSDGRTIRRYEAGDRAIPGPVELAIAYLVHKQKCSCFSGGKRKLPLE